MYPLVRTFKEFVKFRNAPPLEFDGVHVSHHICWPWDLDPFMELNNGRALTLYDLGRLVLGRRAGLLEVLKRERWNMTMAGVFVRYRRRVKVFDRFEMRSRALGWDDRFFYLDQTMWKSNGECASQAVYRVAITNRDGLVPTAQALEALGVNDKRIALPEWVQGWIDAEAKRPWPPTQD